MVHSIIAIDAPPKQHEELIKRLENAKYPYEGHRTGYNIPLISEVRLYNIRIRDTVEPQMLKDLHCRNMFDFKSYEGLLDTFSSKNQGRTRPNLFKRLLIRLFLFIQKRLLRLIGVKESKIADNITFKLYDGFLYSYYLGTIPDLKTKEGHDLL